MAELKIIETHYNGHLFRSRTEARWACFMDRLGVPYLYEHEGYDLGGLWYLPDFWLPEQEIFLEVKPPIASDECPDMTKQAALSEASGYQVVTLCGVPRWDETVDRYGQPYAGYVPCDYLYIWCECPRCGAIGIQFEGRSERNKHKKWCSVTDLDKIYNWDSLRLLAAYKAASEARFEDIQKLARRRN